MAYRDHSGAVHAAARGFFGSAVADDVTEEVFLHLWRHPELHDLPRASLRTSLLTVTHDVSAETMRSETTGRTSPRGPSFDHVQDAADEHSLVAQALSTLRREERDAIVTAYYGGCTYREAAVALRLDEATVKSRMRTGLHHLRAALARSTSSGHLDVDGDNEVNASVSDEGLAAALRSRQVIAQAQGIIMQRDGSSASEAYRALVQLSEQRGVSLPDCAEVVVATARSGSPNSIRSTDEPA